MTKKIVAKRNKKLEFDDKGFFVILVDKDKGKIVVEHYLNVNKGNVLATGKLNKIIEGKDAEEICHAIVKENLVSKLEHATYIGRELQKAEIALKNNLPYEQDSELKSK